MFSLTVSSEQTRGRYRAHRADIRTVVAKILRYRELLGLLHGANGKGAIKKVFVVPDNSCLALGKSPVLTPSAAKYRHRVVGPRTNVVCKLKEILNQFELTGICRLM